MAVVTQVSSSAGGSSPGPGATMVSAAGTGLPQASHRPDRSTCPPSAACRNSRRGPPGAQMVDAGASGGDVAVPQQCGSGEQDRRGVGGEDENGSPLAEQPSGSGEAGGVG